MVKEHCFCVHINTHTHKIKRGREERKGKERKGEKGKRISLLCCAALVWRIGKGNQKKQKQKNDFVLWKEIAEERSRREKGCSLYLSLSLSQITIRFHRGRRGRTGIISRYKRKKVKENEEKNFHTYKQTRPKSRAPLSLSLCHCCC